MMKAKYLIPLFTAITFCVCAQNDTNTLHDTAPPTPLQKFLQDGQFKEGVEFYSAPANNEERFSLALLQVFDALHQFAEGLNKVSINPELMQLSGMPTPMSDQSVTAVQIAGMFNTLKASLKEANTTLSKIDDEPFIVPVNFADLQFDAQGEGIFSVGEMLLSPMMNSGGNTEAIIHFDSADAAWLQGYTHVVPGLLEVLTAYDWLPVWNQCAHHVFNDPQPVPPIARYSTDGEIGSTSQMADFMAALHDLRLELVDPEGLKRARDEFRGMVRCSRICWKRILAETDNDHEWLPSPSQTGPGGALVTMEQIDAWHQVLDEMDAVLSGEKLLAHWRIKEGAGINIDKLVNNPPKFDFVLITQGSALIPYLEEGPTSDMNTWRELTNPFAGGFALFALWSN